MSFGQEMSDFVNSFSTGATISQNWDNTNSNNSYRASETQLNNQRSDALGLQNDATKSFMSDIGAGSDSGGSKSDPTSKLNEVQSLPGAKPDASFGQTQFVNGMMTRGWSRDEAAALAGNSFVESAGFQPGVKNYQGSGAYGLGQMLGVRKDGMEAYAKEQGKPAIDPQVQMDWFNMERHGQDAKYRPDHSSEQANYERALASGNLDEMTYGIGLHVERPSAGDLRSSMKTRISAARQAWQNGGDQPGAVDVAGTYDPNKSGGGGDTADAADPLSSQLAANAAGRARPHTQQADRERQRQALAGVDGSGTNGDRPPVTKASYSASGEAVGGGGSIQGLKDNIVFSREGAAPADKAPVQKGAVDAGPAPSDNSGTGVDGQPTYDTSSLPGKDGPAKSFISALLSGDRNTIAKTWAVPGLLAVHGKELKTYFEGNGLTPRQKGIAAYNWKKNSDVFGPGNKANAGQDYNALARKMAVASGKNPDENVPTPTQRPSDAPAQQGAVDVAGAGQPAATPAADNQGGGAYPPTDAESGQTPDQRAAAASPVAGGDTPPRGSGAPPQSPGKPTDEVFQLGHQGIHRAINFAHKNLDVHKPMGIDDGSNDAKHHVYLSGAGATPDPVYDRLAKHVDPDGSMPIAQRNLALHGYVTKMAKVIGKPWLAERANLSLVQTERKMSNAYAAYAKAALEHGDTGAAIKAAKSSFDWVSNGETLNIQPSGNGNYQVTVSDEKGKIVVDQPMSGQDLTGLIQNHNPAQFDQLIVSAAGRRGASPSPEFTRAMGALKPGADGKLPPLDPGLAPKMRLNEWNSYVKAHGDLAKEQTGNKAPSLKERSEAQNEVESAITDYRKQLKDDDAKSFDENSKSISAGAASLLTSNPSADITGSDAIQFAHVMTYVDPKNPSQPPFEVKPAGNNKVMVKVQGSDQPLLMDKGKAEALIQEWQKASDAKVAELGVKAQRAARDKKLQDKIRPAVDSAVGKETGPARKPEAMANPTVGALPQPDLSAITEPAKPAEQTPDIPVSRGQPQAVNKAREDAIKVFKKSMLESGAFTPAEVEKKVKEYTRQLDNGGK